MKRPLKSRETALPEKVAPTKKAIQSRRNASSASQQPNSSVAKPTVILVGADKGGVGKTTLTRALLDYLALKRIDARAFDADAPRGMLKGFHPDVTTIVDLTSTSDQMKIVDTLKRSKTKVSVVDVRAGGLSFTLNALDEIGFFDVVDNDDFRFILLHVVSPCVSSLQEIAKIAPYVTDSNYFIVKNYINDTTFFECGAQTHARYFADVSEAGEMTIPKLDHRHTNMLKARARLSLCSLLIRPQKANSRTTLLSYVDMIAPG
jgi:hypothetical protein